MTMAIERLETTDQKKTTYIKEVNAKNKGKLVHKTKLTHVDL